MRARVCTSRNSSNYTWGLPDSLSVMVQPVPPELLLPASRGRCGINENGKLSQNDIQATKRAYPSAPTELQRTRGATASLPSNLPDDLKERLNIQKRLAN